MKRYALTGLLLGCILGCQPADTDSKTVSFPLKKMNFAREVKVEGEIKPFRSETLTTPRRLWGTLEILAPEGKIVKKGEIIAKINTREFQERISRYTERMELERNELSLKQAEMPLERLKIQNQIQNKGFQTQQKTLDLKLLQKGPRQDEQIKARIDVEIPTEKRSQYPLEEKKQLYNKGYLSDQELETAQLEYARLQTEAEKAAISEYQLTPEYKKDELTQAQLEQERLQLGLKVSKIEGDARKTALKMRTRNSKSRLKRYTRRFKSFDQRMKQAEIKAPVAGVVVYPMIFGNSKPYVGMQVWGGSPLVEVADISQLKILARVNEFDIAFVKLGQKVALHSLSYPNKTFDGTVAKINKLAKYKEENKPVGLKYFDVEITLPKTPPELKTHMTVDLSIQTDRVPDAWTVPLEALVEDKKKQYVLFDEGGEPVKKEVTVLSKGQDFAVLKGEFSPEQKYFLPGARS